MKRTGETILSIIGMLGYGLIAAFGSIMLVLQDNETFLQDLEENSRETSSGDLNVNAVLDGMSIGGWLFVIASILAILLSFVAIFLMKGNKRPKTAGIIFIVTAVLAAISTVGIGIIPSIFLLISGIMCLVRK
ncbi:DUF4064 domain-containing protein [Gracilibacillus phocaeensis]|uniref:DUF4064 domain-containing protein n=1 Tax=Gracilibacillus phocaeensis TaxID=2042304 RepID=UPI001032790F|nr:DUF4064 domain-containing protein [Gracilibacillus phocaeensis]